MGIGGDSPLAITERKGFLSILKYLKFFLANLQAKEAQRIADAQALQRQQQIDNYDRGIIRKQLLQTLSKMPESYNLHANCVFFDGTDADSLFVYKLSKRYPEKHISVAICQEIADAFNTSFAQLSYDAFEVTNFAYQDAVYQIQTVLAELSARADWNTPEIQARYNAEFLKAKKAYELSYRNNAPFLVKLRVIGVVEDDTHVIISVCVADESEAYRLNPNAISFC